MGNTLLIAAAGSGKTTYLINKALQIYDENILITTYTEANAEEIKKKIVLQNGYVPKNIFIQTWFSFLLSHGVRPFQDLMDGALHERRIGFYLTERPSGFRYSSKMGKPVYWGESDFFKYYFTPDLKIYSDKIAKFIIKCNTLSHGQVLNRISMIYPHIFIDEVQDLAGWELEFIKMLFLTKSEICLVGDPRQVTYLTHHPAKYVKYKEGKINKFIESECDDGCCKVDPTTLNTSHRNNQEICDFANKIFPEFEKCSPCNCLECRNNIEKHHGIYLVEERNVDEYLLKFNPTILRLKGATYPEWNFGKSKGLTFDHVLIYPTTKIKNWLNNNATELPITTRCKFYVSVTRAKYSVGFVIGNSERISLEGAKYHEV